MNRSRKIIAGLSAGAIMLSSGIALKPDVVVNVCVEANICENITILELRALMMEVMHKYKKGDPLSYDEYRVLVYVWNWQAKHGGVEIGEVDSGGGDPTDIGQKINNSIITKILKASN